MPKSNKLAKSAREAANKSGKKGGSSWLTKGRENVESKKSQGGGFSFVREFFLKNKQTAIIRIDGDTIDEITRSVGRHQFRHMSKSGKEYYTAFTCTGDENCLGCRTGSKASQRWPLLVVDKTKGQKVRIKKDDKFIEATKNAVGKMWLPSVNELEKLEIALTDYKEQTGKDRKNKIRNCVFKVSRVGQKAQTAYLFTVIKGGLEWDDEETKALARFKKEFGDLEEVLKPVSKDEQRRIMGTNVNGKDGDEDDTEDEDDNDDEDDTEDDDGDDEDLGDVEDLDDEDEPKKKKSKKKKSKKKDDDEEEEDEDEEDEDDGDDEDEDEDEDEEDEDEDDSDDDEDDEDDEEEEDEDEE